MVPEQAERALCDGQELTQAILNSLTDCIAVLDKDGTILAVSESWKCLGLEAEKTPLIGMAVGVNYLDVCRQVSMIQSAGAPKASTGIQAVLNSTSERFFTEYRCATSPTTRWFLMSVSPLKREGGGAVVVHSDITERRKLEEHLVERKRLEAHFRQTGKLEAIGKLAGGIAHDFNNLLTIMLGYCEVLLNRFTREDPNWTDINEVKKAADKARSLTNSLLAFSRRQVLQPKVLDLNDLVAGLHTMLKRLIGEDIDFVTALEPNLLRVQADPGQLEQVLMNLIVNAREAMPEGGLLNLETKTVTFPPGYQRGSVTLQGSYALLSVTDTGRGMDAGTQTRIFEPFFTTKGHGKGTGLGLATTYGIVKQSGGFIFVNSFPGKGTTFQIYLPRVDGTVEKAGAENGRDGSSGGTETILLVEDEPEILSLLSRILRNYGYTVLVAKDGMEAEEKSRRYGVPIHLLLTDLVMPHMNGRQVSTRLRASRPDMKVLYISGFSEDAWEHHKILDGACPLLQKPFSPKMLLCAIRKVLDPERGELEEGEPHLTKYVTCSKANAQ